MTGAAGVVEVVGCGGDLVNVELHPAIRTNATMHKIRIEGTMEIAIIVFLIFYHPFLRTGASALVQVSSSLKLQRILHTVIVTRSGG